MTSHRPALPGEPPPHPGVPTKPRSNRSSRRGAQAVEFTLLLPVMMMIISAVVDSGWFYHQRMLFIDAVRQGARAGAIANPYLTNYCAAAKNTTNSALTASGFTAGTQVSAETSGTAPSRIVNVVAKRDFTKLIGLVPTPPRLNVAIHMRIEDQTAPDCDLPF
jgi:Flp pilus assembly protein TadG